MAGLDRLPAYWRRDAEEDSDLERAIAASMGVEWATAPPTEKQLDENLDWDLKRALELSRRDAGMEPAATPDSDIPDYLRTPPKIPLLTELMMHTGATLDYLSKVTYLKVPRNTPIPKQKESICVTAAALYAVALFKAKCRHDFALRMAKTYATDIRVEILKQAVNVYHPKLMEELNKGEFGYLTKGKAEDHKKLSPTSHKRLEMVYADVALKVHGLIYEGFSYVTDHKMKVTPGIYVLQFGAIAFCMYLAEPKKGYVGQSFIFDTHLDHNIILAKDEAIKVLRKCTNSYLITGLRAPDYDPKAKIEVPPTTLEKSMSEVSL